jgi:glutamate synthase (NADPH/NADH) small chain
MGMVTGFLQYPRKNMSYCPVEERLKHFNEFVQLQAEDELKRQGARCMNCGIPYCHALGCPVYNLIPEWNDLVYRGKWREAYERLAMTNNLPEVTGRICPAPCEASCTLSINVAPVTIKQLELAIIERAFQEGWVEPRRPSHETGKRIAVIGSGPAGMAAASQLRRFGHTVVLFEKATKMGGILRYGVPNYKLEKRIIDRRLELMKSEGIQFETDVTIGEDLSVRYLKKTFDCILLALGAGEPRDLPVPGRGLEGVHYAMEYLTRMNKFLCGEIKEHEIISAKDKNVLVIGGGDTGADCVGTANRQGARQIYQFEILAKPREWNKEYNPEWPNWPNILHTASAHEEGCLRDWGITTKQFSGSGIKVGKTYCTRVDWELDPKTNRWNMQEKPGTEFTIDVDLVFLAMGFLHVEHSKLLKDLGVAFDERGNIKVDTQYATSVPGVFAAGDSHSGAYLVVRSIFHGRQAANAVHEYLLKV